MPAEESARGGGEGAAGDVTAVVLTLGEPTTDRALASVRRQTLPVADVVVVSGRRPFHRAFAAAVERVRTPFFLQVDADMVLDPGCAEVLRAAMAPGVGIAVGGLRDPMAGTIAGIKLFRRDCFAVVGLADRVMPEVDYYHRLGRLGWHTRYVIGDGGRRMRAGTLGEHAPGYEPDYVYGTYYLLAAGWAQREDARAVLFRTGALRRSRHPLAPVARVSLGHGLFADETRDVPKPAPPPATATLLRDLARAGDDDPAAVADARRLIGLPRERLVAGFCALGASLRGSPAALRRCLRAVAQAPQPASLLAEAALAHGALAGSARPPRDSAARLCRLAATWEREQSRPLAA